MKRSEMFEILSVQYDHERKRYEYLHTKANSSLTIAGLLCTGLGLFAGKELLANSNNQIVFFIHVLGMVCLIFAIISVIMAIMIRGYREIVDIKTLIIEAEENQYEHEDIYSVMLANMADCSEHNGALMDSAFNWLSSCSIFLCSAILLMTIGVIFQSIIKFF